MFTEQEVTRMVLAAAAEAWDTRRCQCSDPTPFRKPSGAVICINDACGLPIGTPRPVVERP